MALRILTVPATAALLAFFGLLPASAVLTHIEAALLPADVQPIVPLDTSFAAPGSFDRAARLRVLKVYAKMVFMLFPVALAGITVLRLAAVIGRERLALLYTRGGRIWNLWRFSAVGVLSRGISFIGREGV
jgi:hypothetical protein